MVRGETVITSATTLVTMIINQFKYNINPHNLANKVAISVRIEEIVCEGHPDQAA